MTVKILDDQEKAKVVELYTQKDWNQTLLAAYFGVSRNTIHRVLKKVGALESQSRLTPDQTAMLKMLSTSGMTPNALYTLIKDGEISGSAITKDQEDMLQLIESYGLNNDTLHQALEAPALTYSNVQKFCNSLSKRELAELFYTSGLYKITQMIQKNKEEDITEVLDERKSG